jgi:hypothetical protein
MLRCDRPRDAASARSLLRHHSIGTLRAVAAYTAAHMILEEDTMNGLIYIIGLIVVIAAVLSFFGLR